MPGCIHSRSFRHSTTPDQVARRYHASSRETLRGLIPASSPPPPTPSLSLLQTFHLNPCIFRRHPLGPGTPSRNKPLYCQPAFTPANPRLPQTSCLPVAAMYKQQRQHSRYNFTSDSSSHTSSRAPEGATSGTSASATDPDVQLGSPLSLTTTTALPRFRLNSDPGLGLPSGPRVESHTSPSDRPLLYSPLCKSSSLRIISLQPANTCPTLPVQLTKKQEACNSGSSSGSSTASPKSPTLRPHNDVLEACRQSSGSSNSTAIPTLFQPQPNEEDSSIPSCRYASSMLAHPPTSLQQSGADSQNLYRNSTGSPTSMQQSIVNSQDHHRSSFYSIGNVLGSPSSCASSKSQRSGFQRPPLPPPPLQPVWNSARGRLLSAKVPVACMPALSSKSRPSVPTTSDVRPALAQPAVTRMGGTSLGFGSRSDTGRCGRVQALCAVFGGELGLVWHCRGIHSGAL